MFLLNRFREDLTLTCLVDGSYYQFILGNGLAFGSFSIFQTLEKQNMASQLFHNIVNIYAIFENEHVKISMMEERAKLI